MTQQEIINGNKLIAEFMGYKNLRSPKEYPLYKIPEHSYEINNEGSTELVDTFELNWDLCFHSSFDWLIPVVEKIESLGYWVNFIDGDVFINNNEGKNIIPNPMHEDGYSKLTITYEIVLNFINWYNNQK